jgi:metallo-beta-lactamase family protein
LLESDQTKLLVDCGMFQGGDFNESRNSNPLPFNPVELSAVFVTHAHLDHVGRLPLLIKGGYQGYIYTNPATAELARLVLEDALEVMTYNNKKLNTPILYSATDIAEVVTRFKPVEYRIPTIIKGVGNECAVTFYDAGHIFGAAFIQLDIDGKRVVFSGDVGNKYVPILQDTDPLPANIDLLVCESTYGNRSHEPHLSRQQVIQQEVLSAVKRGGVLMIPAFSLERTQELLYELNELMNRKKLLPHIPIFLDSPLAIDALAVYKAYPAYYDEAAKKYFEEQSDLFEFPGLVLTRTREESKKINSTPGPKIIIAGSGMMNGGRILHHALRYLSDERNTLLLVGYQAEGTLGRKLLEGERNVEIFKENVAVKCQVKMIGILSAHADQHKLVEWIGGAPTLPRQMYFNHGDKDASATLARLLEDRLKGNAHPAAYGLSVEI